MTDIALKPERSKLTGHILLTCMALSLPGVALAQLAAQRGTENPVHPCGMIYTRHYGPYDYRTHRGALKVVEEFHFKPYMEAGIRGDNAPVGGEISYTLKASPNHIRALVAMNHVVDRAGNEQTPGMEWPMECYYDRAIRFAPDDPLVRMLYARFLHKRNRRDDALRQLHSARALAADNPITLQSLGLVYLELGYPTDALREARTAQALGLEISNSPLIKELQRLGQWREGADAQDGAASAPVSGPIQRQSAEPEGPAPGGTKDR